MTIDENQSSSSSSSASDEDQRSDDWYVIQVSSTDDPSCKWYSKVPHIKLVLHELNSAYVAYGERYIGRTDENLLITVHYDQDQDQDQEAIFKWNSMSPLRSEGIFCTMDSGLDPFKDFKFFLYKEYYDLMNREKVGNR